MDLKGAVGVLVLIFMLRARLLCCSGLGMTCSLARAIISLVISTTLPPIFSKWTVLPEAISKEYLEWPN